MSKKAEDVYREAMALSDEEREKRRDLLMSGTSNGNASPEIERAWREEIERRVEALDRGDMELIPHEEVFRRLRARFIR
jgi:hypothetical protein